MDEIIFFHFNLQNTDENLDGMAVMG